MKRLIFVILLTGCSIPYSSSSVDKKINDVYQQLEASLKQEAVYIDTLNRTVFADNIKKGQSKGCKEIRLIDGECREAEKVTTSVPVPLPLPK